MDLATGKRLWEVPANEAGETATGAADGDFQGRPRMPFSSAEQRLFNDLTYGTLSSDGRYVFDIEDAWPTAGQAARGQPINAMVRRGMGWPGGLAEQATLCNRLAAYEIRTGKLKWQMKGLPGQGDQAPAELFFLGPPLPLTGQLYVLAEVQGEIRLLAIEAATGNLLWSQQLAAAEQGFLQEPMRGWAGVSPSYADGVLVCPTSSGAIVGVDLATRTLLWGYQYAQNPGRGGRRPFGMMGFRGRYGGLAMLRTSDADACIVDGRVVANPFESDSLHCLSLSDGKVLWKCPRQDDLYVACADAEKVVLVGRHAVRALRLADGQPAWDGRMVELPENSSPSGRGFSAGSSISCPWATPRSWASTFPRRRSCRCASLARETCRAI